jgi:hypothetical protein
MVSIASALAISKLKLKKKYCNIMDILSQPPITWTDLTKVFRALGFSFISR